MNLFIFKKIISLLQNKTKCYNSTFAGIFFVLFTATNEVIRILMVVNGDEGVNTPLCRTTLT